MNIQEQHKAITSGIFDGRIKSLNDLCLLFDLTKPVAKERLKRIYLSFYRLSVYYVDKPVSNNKDNRALVEPYLTMDALYNSKDIDGFLAWLYQNNGMLVALNLNRKIRLEIEANKIEIWQRFYAPLSRYEVLVILEDAQIQCGLKLKANPLSEFNESLLYSAPEEIVEAMLTHLRSMTKAHFLLYRGAEKPCIKNIEVWLNLKGGVFLGDLTLADKKEQRVSKAIKYLQNNGYTVTKNS